MRDRWLELRRVVGAILILAGTAWFAFFLRHSAGRLILAARHADLEAKYRYIVKASDFRDEQRRANALAEHHAHLRHKYQAAAVHPWTPIPPDPPEPR